MRPVELRVAGLHSYKEPVTIDFSELGAFGFFGILGPIGAGKSTLLDAITLALYGQVDRLQGRARRGLIHHDAKQIDVRFRFSLSLGPNTKQTYEVHRLYRRDSGGDSVHIHGVRLTALNELGEDEVLADKDRAVNAEVERLLGLSAEDFMRAVVLPQGRFQQFLHLKGSERRQMLQRIFRLGAYGRGIRDQVRKRLADKASRVATLEGERAALGDTSPEALQAAMDAVQEADEARERLATEAIAIQTRHRRAQRVRERAAAVREVERELARHREREAEFAALERQVVRAERVQGVLAPKRAWDRALREHSATIEPAEKAGAALLEADGALERALQKQEEARTELTRKQPLLRRRLERLGRIAEQHRALREALARQRHLQADHRDAAVRSRRAREVLERAAGVRREKAAQRRDLAAAYAKTQVESSERLRIQRAARALDRLKHQEQEVRLAREAVKAATRQESAAAERLAAEERAREAAGERLIEKSRQLEQLAARGPNPEALAALAERVELGKRQQEELDGAEMAHRRAEQEAERRRSALERAEAAASRCEEMLTRQRTRLDQVETSLEQARLHVLAASLSPGSACPVCGSASHPSPARAPEPGEPSEALPIVAAALQDAVAEHAAAKERVLHTRDQLVAAEKELAACRKQTKELRAAREFPDPESLVEAIASLAALEGQRERWREESSRLGRETDALRLEVERLGAPVAAARSALEGARTRTEQAIEVLERREGHEGDAWVVFRDGAGDLTPFEIPSAVSRLEKLDARASELYPKLDALDEELAALQVELDKADRDRDQAAEAETRLGEQLRACEQEVSQLRRALGDWPETEDPATAIAELEAQEASLSHDVAAAERAASDQASRRARLASTAAANQARRTAAERALADAEQALDAALAEAELGGPREQAAREALAAALEPGVLAQHREAIRSWREGLAGLEARLAAVRVDLPEEPALTDEAWTELSRELRAANQRSDDALAAKSEAAHALRDLKRRRARASELGDELAGDYAEQRRLQTLEQLFRGNRFVEFIANDYLRELVTEATRHLDVLTLGRYTLLLDEEGGFLIRDRDAGGAERPVTSLSGGETFLTSLALALALSSQVQARGNQPLEFFFLDEGFGALDLEALDRVLTAIESLASPERMIGIISHVAAVRERLGRYLLVHEAGSDGTGSWTEVVDN